MKVQVREFLVFTAVDHQAVSGQVIFGHQALYHLDKLCQEWIKRIQFRERTDIFFGEDDHMKGMGRLRVRENQQGIRFT